MRKPGKLSLGLVFFFLMSMAWQTALGAGIYWEMTKVSEGMPQGLPGNLPKEVLAQMSQKQQDSQKAYMSEDGYRMEGKDGIIIMDYKGLMVYRINPADKTYNKIDVRQFAEGKDMKSMMEEMQKNTKVTPTEETKKIAGYTCKKYRVDAMMGKSVYWASTEVEGFDLFREIIKKTKKDMQKNPMFSQMGGNPVMDKIDGFLVQTESDVMGVKTKTTLKKIEVRDFDKSLFSVPAGYTEKPMPGMAGAVKP